MENRRFPVPRSSPLTAPSTTPNRVENRPPTYARITEEAIRSSENNKMTINQSLLNLHNLFMNLILVYHWLVANYPAICPDIHQSGVGGWKVRILQLFYSN